jgi:hypothetical protein
MSYIIKEGYKPITDFPPKYSTLEGIDINGKSHILKTCNCKVAICSKLIYADTRKAVNIQITQYKIIKV